MHFWLAVHCIYVPSRDATVQLAHGSIHALFFLTTVFGSVQFGSDGFAICDLKSYYKIL